MPHCHQCHMMSASGWLSPVSHGVYLSVVYASLSPVPHGVYLRVVHASPSPVPHVVYLRVIVSASALHNSTPNCSNEGLCAPRVRCPWSQVRLCAYVSCLQGCVHTRCAAHGHRYVCVRMSRVCRVVCTPSTLPMVTGICACPTRVGVRTSSPTMGVGAIAYKSLAHKTDSVCFACSLPTKSSAVGSVRLRTSSRVGLDSVQVLTL